MGHVHKIIALIVGLYIAVVVVTVLQIHLLEKKSRNILYYSAFKGSGYFKANSYGFSQNWINLKDLTTKKF